jgi:4-amino-4-deoxy-L-arabinose transferase-like glycosyltransferase
MAVIGRQRSHSGPAGRFASSRPGSPPGLLLLLLSARLAVGVAYSLVIPPWEGVDEDAHFAYAQYLAAHHDLLSCADPEAAQIRENHQPPLYYLLVAAVLVPLRASQPPVVVARNPYLSAGAGFNYAIQPAQVDPAAQSVLRALYAARWLTIVLSTAGALAVYCSARRLWPTQPLAALTATAIYAFWPEQLYLGSVVNNDALVTAWSALIFYIALRVVLDGATPGRVLLLVGSLAAAALTKLNGLSLGLPVVIALAWGLSRSQGQRAGRVWLAIGVVGLGLIGVLAWLASMAFVKGQVLQLQTVRDFLKNAVPARQFGLAIVLPGFANALRSFLGEFGWGSLFLPDWMYWFWGAALVLGVLALVNAAFEPQARLPAGVMTVALAQLFAAVALALALGVAANNPYLVIGRYLLPALPALAILWAAGWRASGSHRLQSVALSTLSVAVILTGWCVPWFILAPAYARPVTLPPNAVVEHALGITFDQSIELVGYQNIERARVVGQINLTLCWRSVRPIGQNYTIRIEALSEAGQTVGVLMTYPGHGNYATSLWKLNELFCDPYAVRSRNLTGPIYPDALRVSVLEETSRQSVRAIDNSGPIITRSVVIQAP